MEGDTARDGDASRARPARRLRLRLATVRVRLVGRPGAPETDPITGPSDVWRLLGPIAETWDRERFVSLILDGKSRLLGVDEVAVGSLRRRSCTRGRS